MSKKIATREAYGKALAELAKENEYTARISYILIEEINIIEDY